MKRTAEQLREEQRFITNRKIVKEAARAFYFMSGMAKDLDDAVKSLILMLERIWYVQQPKLIY